MTGNEGTQDEDRKILLDEVNHRLKDLMYGLFYPAVLGTGFFLLLERVVHHGQLGSVTIYGVAIPFISVFQDKTVYATLLAIVFFSMAFDSSKDMRKYRIYAFMLDLLEVILMFSIFVVLGLLGDGPFTKAPAVIRLDFFYFIFASLVLLQLYTTRIYGFRSRAPFTAHALLITIMGGAIGASLGDIVTDLDYLASAEFIHYPFLFLCLLATMVGWNIQVESMEASHADDLETLQMAVPCLLACYQAGATNGLDLDECDECYINPVHGCEGCPWDDNTKTDYDKEPPFSLFGLWFRISNSFRGSGF